KSLPFRHFFLLKIVADVGASGSDAATKRLGEGQNYPPGEEHNMYESFIYHPEKGIKTGASGAEITGALQDGQTLIWIDVSDIDDSDIDMLTSVFNLHPITIEDFIMPNARPKIEKFKDYFFLVMFSLEQNGEKEGDKVSLGELNCCLGTNFLITFHNCLLRPVGVCKERSIKRSQAMTNGADMLLYTILDSCVESYFPIVKKFDNHVDEIGDELFAEPNKSTLKKIYHLKNEIISLRRNIGPQADIISSMARGDFGFISPANAVYFRNIYDSLVRLNDTIGTMRDVITGAMEAYTSLMSNRLNEVMKTLTIIATIMMPLTLVASIYGMNFKHMPELESKLGYPIVIAIMVAITATMLVYFKRRKWL
ncbi:MAG: magnesium/cobalt transporter CorA, partial [Candidatus Omnitrophota bacterium]|nr:magnesium/cobalt transporter CorA [Candidatus Omnitrophota bacterium]